MSLTYSLNTSLDLYKKLFFDYNNLENEISAYCFFNFIITAFHLVDWIEKDKTISKPNKAKINVFKNTIEFKICRDLARASKHFTLDQKSERQKIIADTNHDSGYSVGRYSQGAYSIGEESIIITLTDGTSYDSLALATFIISFYKDFFKPS